MSPSPITRRSALRLGTLGLVVAVAGCSAPTGEESPDGTATPTSSEPTTTTNASEHTVTIGETATSETDLSVRISDPQVEKIIFTPDEGTITHAYPSGGPHSQFITVSVSSPEQDISSLDLAPAIEETAEDGRTYRHTFSPGSSGKLSFPVPIVEAESGAIEWRPSETERYRWPLPDSVLGTIARSPEFEVTDFSVPETISKGDDFAATVTVRNTGNRDGRFLAVVLDEGAGSVPLHDAFTVTVPVGEGVTQELSGATLDREPSSVTTILDWGIGERRTSFRVSE